MSNDCNGGSIQEVPVASSPNGGLDRLKDDIRSNEQALLDELSKSGVAVRNPRAIKCPFHGGPGGEKKPSARIESHHGVYRFVCRAASCGTCEDIFGVRAKFAGRPTTEVMRDWRREERAAQRPGERSFFKTRERLAGGHPGQDGNDTPSKADAGKQRPKQADSKAEWIQTYALKAKGCTVVDYSDGYAPRRPGSVKVDRFLKIRLNNPDGSKRFAVGTLHPGGLISFTAPAGTHPLYFNATARAALALGSLTSVFVTEGEKAADELADKHNEPAVSAPFGASKNARPETADWSELAGKDVLCWPDPEVDAMAFMTRVGEYLRDEHRATVYLIDPAKLGLSGKEDAVDWCARHPETDIRDIEVAMTALPLKTEPGHVRPAPSGDRAKLTRMSTVQAKKIDWLWDRRFALGKLSMISGDPGRGKSTVAIDMIARVTTGSPWPDGTPCPIGSAILIMCEDGLDDTVRPRLDAHRADCERVFALEGVEAASDKKERSFTLADLPALEDALVQAGDCKLVIIDPVSAFLGAKDSHKNAEVRSALGPLAKLAEQYGVAIVMITHLNKGGGSRALYRSMDSLAFVAAARAAYLIADDPEDPSRRLMLPTKNNIGNDKTGFAYEIIDGRITWERDEVTTNADDVIGGTESKRGPNPERRHEAEDWLNNALRNGPVYQTDLETQAKVEGLKWATVRNAQKALGVKSQRCSYSSKWQWHLPPSMRIAAA